MDLKILVRVFILLRKAFDILHLFFQATEVEDLDKEPPG